MYQGATWKAPIAIVDYLGDAMDLTNCTLRGNIRKNALDTGTPLITIACDITDAASGYADLVVPKNLTSAITVGEHPYDSASLHWYDIELVWDDADVQRIIEGSCVIDRDVTRTGGGIGFLAIGSTFVVS
tara:strand:- start:406 stop:795 length:390 start_codon:yes stop_codon:yes gene_type:complete